MSSNEKSQVFFNSSCPVCKAGVAAQQEVMQACGAQIEWIDVAKDPQAVSLIGASLDAVRERLYVKDEHGQTHVGSDAFAALWIRTPLLRWLGKALSWPIFALIARKLYNLFARQLYRWNQKRGRW